MNAAEILRRWSARLASRAARSAGRARTRRRAAPTARPAVEALEIREVPALAPNVYEQLFLERLNDARANPTAYGASIGVDLSSFSPTQPLAFDAQENPSPPPADLSQLIQASRPHSQHMATTGTVSKTGSGGSTPAQRIAATGYITFSSFETVQAASADPAAALAAMISDADTSKRNHLLGASFPFHNNVGIGYVSNGSGPSQTYYTIDSAQANNPIPDGGALLFLTGTVFNDWNANGRYDVGEGVPNVAVHVNGSLATSTWSTGGFTYQLPSAGDYTVTVPSLGLPAQNVSATTQNVRVSMLQDVLPGIQVKDGTTVVPSGTGSVDFGSTFSGLPVTKTFTVTNSRTANLTLGSSITLPAGFTLVSGFGTTNLIPGASTSFTVRYNAAALGTASGQVSFATNVDPSNPFTFTISGAAVTVQTRDDAAATLSPAGAWTPYSGQGFNGSLRYTPAGDGSATATWTVPVSPGQYRVSTTWTGHANRAVNVPYTVLDASSTLATVIVNQQQAPADRTDQGVSWKDLGTFNVYGTSLAVRLASAPFGYVIADGLRVERLGDLPAVGVQVLDGATAVPAGSTVQYGTTSVGSPVTKTFTVRNSGSGTLTLGAITVPAGFSLAAGFGSTSLASGATTTFQVRLDAAAVGAATGSVSFVTSDSSLNPFTFTVTGTTTAVAITDNTDAGFSEEGDWILYSGQGLGGSLRYADPGSVSSVATWTTAVSPGVYRVSTTWPGHSNRTMYAFHYVYDDSSYLTAVSVNQQPAPSDFTDGGVGWHDLGVFPVYGSSVVVQLYGAADGYVIADAVRVERVADLPATTVQVRDGVTFIPAGGTADFGSTQVGLPVTKTFTVRNNGTDPLTLGAITVPAGFTLTSDFGTTLLSPGDSTTFQVSLAAAAAGASTGTVSFVTSDPVLNPYSFTVTGSATATRIIDNSQADFTTGGPWTPYAGGGLNGSLLFTEPGSGSWASWTANVAPGRYRVSATWTPHSNRAIDATYYVTDYYWAWSDPIRVDQQLAPADRTDAGVGWKDLATFDVYSSYLNVQLNYASYGYVIADAIRIERVGDLPAASVQVRENGRTYIPASGTADFGTALAGVPVTKTFWVINNGTDTLTLGAISLPAGYTLAADFISTTLGVGGIATFQVQLDAAAVGTHTGSVSFTTSDPAFTSYAFNVTGTVGTVAIVDNQDTGFVVGGAWVPSGGQGLNNSLLYAAAGDGATSAYWYFTVVPGQYRVSTTWTAASNRATDAPFTVWDNAYGTVANVAVNQQQAPADRTDAGVGWKDLATFDATGTLIYVYLTNLADGYVLADAIRIERLS